MISRQGSLQKEDGKPRIHKENCQTGAGEMGEGSSANPEGSSSFVDSAQ